MLDDSGFGKNCRWRDLNIVWSLGSVPTLFSNDDKTTLIFRLRRRVHRFQIRSSDALRLSQIVVLLISPIANTFLSLSPKPITIHANLSHHHPSSLAAYPCPLLRLSTLFRPSTITRVFCCFLATPSNEAEA